MLVVLFLHQVTFPVLEQRAIRCDMPFVIASEASNEQGRVIVWLFGQPLSDVLVSLDGVRVFHMYLAEEFGLIQVHQLREPS